MNRDSIQLLASGILLILCSSLSAQHGLKAEFYDGQDFDRYVATQVTDKIDLSWNNTPPVTGIDPHVCSIRWTGRLQAPESGQYKFSARVDDGIRVWVGDQLVIDDWDLNDVGIFNGEAYMEAGKYYDLKVEYFNALIEGEITLLWSIPEEESWYKDLFGKKHEIIKAKHFYLPKEATAPIPEEIIANNSNVVPTTPNPKPRKETPKKKTAERKTPEKIIENKHVKNVSPLARVVPSIADPKKMTPEVIEMFIPKHVQFEQAQVEIMESSFQSLDTLAQFLVQNSYLNIKVEGHTDVAGDPDKNMELSVRRAYAVARYLVKKGVTSDKIKAEGLGATKPLVKTFKKIYHPENRRVSFTISVPIVLRP